MPVMEMLLTKLAEKQEQIRLLQNAVESYMRIESDMESDYIALEKRMQSEIERLKGLIEEAANLIIPNETEYKCNYRREWLLNQIKA